MAIRTQVAFAITPEWVLYHPTLSDRAIRLYGVMMRHADNDTHRCHPSRRRLATAELITAGAVVSSPRQREDGSQTSNDYLMIILPPGGSTGAEGGVGRSEAPSSSKDAAPRTRTNKNIEPVEREYEPAAHAWPDPEFQPIDVTETNEPPSPRSAPPSSPTYEDWEALALHLGWNPRLNVGLNLKILKSLSSAGVTAEQIIGCVEWMRADPWWGPKGVDLKKVSSKMQEYLSSERLVPRQTESYEDIVNGLREVFGDD
jgi:hypothetical protein